MEEFGGFCESFQQVITDNNSTMASCSSEQRRCTEDVRVLLVDRRMDFVTNSKEQSTSMVAEILKQFSYKVTVVESASGALSALSHGKEKFDVLMANFYQPEKRVNIKLLQEAIKMKLLVVQISDEKDENGGEVARRAIEQGVFLYLEKPFPVDMLRYLWQHVYRERKLKKNNEGQGDFDISMAARILINGHNNNESATTFATPPAPNNNNNSSRKRGAKFKWTQELHAKFMDVVNQLGSGNCYPKEIWEMMNVPGLTREKVASHLQRCRDNKWRASEEQGIRRSRSSSRVFSTQPIPIPARRPRHKKFGLMPVKPTTNNVRLPQLDIIAEAADSNEEISSQNGRHHNHEYGSSVTASTNSVTDIDAGVLESSAAMVEPNYCDPHDPPLLEQLQNNPIAAINHSLTVDQPQVVGGEQTRFDDFLNIPEEMLPRMFFGENFFLDNQMGVDGQSFALQHSSGTGS